MEGLAEIPLLRGEQHPLQEPSEFLHGDLLLVVEEVPEVGMYHLEEDSGVDLDVPLEGFSVSIVEVQEPVAGDLLLSSLFGHGVGFVELALDLAVVDLLVLNES